MAVMQMQRVSICALKKDRSAILKKLERLGVMEVNRALPEDDDFVTENTLDSQQEYLRQAQEAERALEVLELYVPEKKSVFAPLEGKRLVGRARLEDVAGRGEEILKEAGHLISLHKEAAEQKAEIQKAENQIESLKPWMSLGIPLDYPGTRRTALLLGSMGAETTLERVYELIAEKAPEAEALDAEIIGSEKGAVYLAVICMKEQAQAVEDALRSGGFVRPNLTCPVTPLSEKGAMEDRIGVCTARIGEISRKIEERAYQREELQEAADYWRMRAGEAKVEGTLPQSGKTFVVSGYVPAGCVEALRQEIGAAYDCVFDVEEIAEDEDAPTILKNNGFSEIVEGVVESYGLPRPGDFDPTTIMSFFYVFFFGMMLSDAAYGAIIAVACFAALKKFPRMDKGLHKTLKLFMYCGLSTVIWGILFGGYFGDVVDVVSKTFFGKTVSIKPLWFAPLNDPMKLLVYSMLFGLIHLFAGLAIQGYIELKESRYMDFFCDVVLWAVFLVGLVLMLIPSDIFASIIQTQIVFPDVLNTAAKAMAIAGALGILVMSERDKKNPVLRLALGAYDLYNVTGWLSDVLSYSRLLALGLATGVIASVVNQMGSMFGKGVVGVIGFAVIFVIGHTMNLAINLLGAYVHTNRLQYVEFFGKFYEGGGRPFEPFRADTKYVEIKEEKTL